MLYYPNRSIHADMLDCRLKQTAFGRWIIVHPHSTSLAWSGAHWEEIDHHGFGLYTQVSNFETVDEASLYAAEVGFLVIAPSS
jgi:hypothetical protein